jgi:hypothetical protein
MSDLPAAMPDVEAGIEHEKIRFRIKYEQYDLHLDCRISIHHPNEYELIAWLKFGGKEFGIMQPLVKQPNEAAFFMAFVVMERRIEILIEENSVPKMPPLTPYAKPTTPDRHE